MAELVDKHGDITTPILETGQSGTRRQHGCYFVLATEIASIEALIHFLERYQFAVNFGTHHAWTAVLGAVVCAALLFWQMPAAPELRPDSASYLNFAGHRTVGYPLFLWLVGAEGALIVQPLLAAVTLGYMGWEVARNLGSAAAGGGVILAVILAVLFDYEVGRFHYAILTESLFVSLLMVLLGVLARVARAPSVGAMALASLMGGLAVSVRPTGLALLPLLFLVALMLWHRAPRGGLALLAAAVLPMLVLLGAERAVGTMVQNDERTSLLPQHLFAKAGMIAAPLAPAGAALPRARLEAALERDFAPIRAVVDGAPSFRAKAHLAIKYERCIQKRCSNALLASVDRQARDRLMLDAALERIARAPGVYIVLSWLHFRSLWMPYAAYHPAVAPQLNAYVQARLPLPFAEQAPNLTSEVGASRRVIVIQPLMIAIGVVTATLAAAGIIAALRRAYLGPAGVLSIAAALAVQGSLALTALTGLAIARYTMTYWPAMMVALAAALVWMLEVAGPEPARRWLRRF